MAESEPFWPFFLAVFLGTHLHAADVPSVSVTRAVKYTSSVLLMTRAQCLPVKGIKLTPLIFLPRENSRKHAAELGLSSESAGRCGGQHRFVFPLTFFWRAGIHQDAAVCEKQFRTLLGRASQNFSMYQI